MMVLNKWVGLLAAAGLMGSLAFACSSKTDAADDDKSKGDDDDDDDSTGDDDDDDDTSGDDDSTGDKVVPKKDGSTTVKPDAPAVGPACAGTDDFDIAGLAIGGTPLEDTLVWKNVGTKQAGKCTPADIAKIKAAAAAFPDGGGNDWDPGIKASFGAAASNCEACALSKVEDATYKAIMPQSGMGADAFVWPNSGGAAVVLGYTTNDGGKALHELNLCLAVTCGACNGKAGAATFGACATFQSTEATAPCYSQWQAVDANVKDDRAFALVFQSSQANSYSGVTDLFCGLNKPTDIDAGPP